MVLGTKSFASDTPVETREALRAELVLRPTETFACRGGAGRACATCLAACSLRDPLPAVAPRSDPLLSCSVKSGRAAKTCCTRVASGAGDGQCSQCSYASAVGIRAWRKEPKTSPFSRKTNMSARTRRTWCGTHVLPLGRATSSPRFPVRGHA